MFYHPSLKKSP